MRKKITVKWNESRRQQKKEDRNVEEIEKVYTGWGVICKRQAERVVQEEEEGVN